LPACHRYSFTAFDQKVISEYRELCKKYHISAQYTFENLFLVKNTMNTWAKFYYQRFAADAFRDKCIKMLQKFIKEFKAGYYELSPLRPHGRMDKLRAFWGLRYAAIKRMSPGKVECPMHLQQCEGGLYPGDCKRHWRECPLFASE
jgi:hypothetical protein